MKNASKIIKILSDNGFSAYIVGGYVRDHLIGRVSADIDISTAATPNEVITIFSPNYKVLPTGIEHGTVTIMVEDIPYEITTFRKDIYSDGRNTTVSFSKTIEEDLSRRDFTINSLAFDPCTGKIIDPFNGRMDLKNKVIRCVGEASNRFTEDYLRMIRAYRFASLLNFSVSPDIEEAISLIVSASDTWDNKLSIERIKMEFDKCFTKSDTPKVFIDGLQRSGMLKKILPELEACVDYAQNKHHKYDVYTHTVVALNAVDKTKPLIRWAALFHDLGKVPSRRFENGDYTFHGHELDSERLCIEAMKRLKFSVEDSKYIANLVRHHMFKCSTEMRDSAIRRFVSSLGVEYVNDLCCLKYGDRVGNGKKSVEELNIDQTLLKKRFTEIITKDSAFKISDLAINGLDVMTIKNIKSSPEVGRILKALLEIVLEDPSKNTKESLCQELSFL